MPKVTQNVVGMWVHVCLCQGVTKGSSETIHQMCIIHSFIIASSESPPQPERAKTAGPSSQHI